MGDKETPAVTLALEEWRHWLEGTVEPFLVLTDQKNLCTSRQPNILMLVSFHMVRFSLVLPPPP